MIVPALSFFKEDLSLDWKANLLYAKRIASYPIHGVILFGSTGEGSSLTINERIELLKLYTDCLDVNLNIYVVLGDGPVLDELQITGVHSDRVTGYLLLPKSENKRIDSYDKRRLKWISQNIPLGKKTYLYSLKKTTGISFSEKDILDELMEEGIHVDGLKISHEELEVLSSLDMNSWRGQPLEIMWGSDRCMVESLSYGASYLVSSMLACCSNIETFQNDSVLIEELTTLRKTVGKGAEKLSKMKQQLASAVNGTCNVRPPYSQFKEE